MRDCFCFLYPKPSALTAHKALLWNHRHPAIVKSKFCQTTLVSLRNLGRILACKSHCYYYNFWMVFLVEIRPLRPVFFRVSVNVQDEAYNVRIVRVDYRIGCNSMLVSLIYVYIYILIDILLIFFAHFIPFPQKFLTPAKIYKNNPVICNSNFIYGARNDLKTEGRTEPEV